MFIFIVKQILIVKSYKVEKYQGAWCTFCVYFLDKLKVMGIFQFIILGYVILGTQVTNTPGIEPAGLGIGKTSLPLIFIYLIKLGVSRF